jgi:diguanylate cyclase (GGDEF)-like protein
MGVWLLLRVGSRLGGPMRRAYRLILAGVVVGVAGLTGTFWLFVAEASVTLTQRLAIFAVGQTLGASLLLAGLLRLPGAADLPGSRLQHVLDGGLLAACALHITWTLIIEPAHTHRLGLPVPVTFRPGIMIIAVPIAVGLCVFGVTSVVIFRARAPRAALGLTGLATMTSMLTGVGLILAVWYGAPAIVAMLGVGYALGLLGAVVAARYTDRLVEPAIDSASGGWVVLTLIPGTLAIVAAVFRVIWLGSTDNVSIAFAAVVGGLLIARQAVAIQDARRYGSRLASSEAHFKTMAHTDALTGLANRRQLMQALHEQAVGGPPCVLLAVDLDGFKSVNDIRGHDMGDAVLVEVARRLKSNLRPGDLAARLGGDEFAVLMWAGPEEARAVAERLLAVLARPYEMADSSIFLSASIGLAGCATAETVATLMHNADLSLRFAKQNGKNRVERYDAAYDQWMYRRTAVEHELRGAIEREELTLAFQPVVALSDGHPVGVEALLRWYHPTLGQVPPIEFIPVAEETGLIARLDRWVLHQACHQLSRWIADGHDVWVAVNISVRELHLAEYVTHVVEVLRAHRVPADRLVLEVTEHAVAVDIDEMIDRLAALREVGVRIALDDFGAGYSSLSQLRRLPVDILKIDHALVAEPASAPSHSAAPLVDVVVRLGHRLGLEVIAEGVAEQAHRAVVEEAQCRLAQGELFCRAVPAEHVEALLAATPIVPTPLPVQNVGQVDSGREMRQS